MSIMRLVLCSGFVRLFKTVTRVHLSYPLNNDGCLSKQFGKVIVSLIRHFHEDKDVFPKLPRLFHCIFKSGVLIWGQRRAQHTPESIMRTIRRRQSGFKRGVLFGLVDSHFHRFGKQVS